jgi:thiol-disulfide isomerase/thioredoxin
MKHYILSFMSSIALYISISPIRGYVSNQLSILSGFVLFYLLSFFWLKKYNENKGRITLSLILGILAIQIPIRWGAWDRSLISLPDSIFNFLGIISAYSFFSTKNKFKYLLPIFAFSASVFMYFQGFGLWLHKLNFGEYLGKVIKPSPLALIGNNEVNERIDLSNRKQYKLLDFWHTKCGYCFEAFPKLEKIYNENSKDTNLLIFAVNKKLGSDSLGQAAKMIKKYNYHFPLFFPEIDSLPEVYGITVYPTSLLVDPNGNIIFKGELEECFLEYAQLRKNNK